MTTTARRTGGARLRPTGAGAARCGVRARRSRSTLVRHMRSPLNSGTAALHVALLAHRIGDPRGSRDWGLRCRALWPAGSDPRHPGRSHRAGVLLRGDGQCRAAGGRTAGVCRRPRGRLRHRSGAARSGDHASHPRGDRRHLYGQTCDIAAVDAICARRGIVLIEDAAQAVGASMRADGRARGGPAASRCTRRRICRPAKAA